MKRKNLLTILAIAGLISSVPMHGAFHSLSCEKDTSESQELSVGDQMNNLLRQKAALAKQVIALQNEQEYLKTKGEALAADLGTKDQILWKLKDASAAERQVLINARNETMATITQIETELEELDNQITEKKNKIAQIESSMKSSK